MYLRNIIIYYLLVYFMALYFKYSRLFRMGAADDLQEKCAKCEKVVYEAEGLPAGKFIIC